ncbi:MAG: hypothetical protein JXR38_04450 [Bacilli bacterium]|nr:hypothetical protein [Bacilli bacterium]
MATYKKGFKKQTSEQMLLQVIVGIIIAVFAIVAVAFIYDLTVGSREYDDFTHITEYDLVLEQKDADQVPLEDYLVYFYYDDCSACASIKDDALKIVAKLNKDSQTVFLANTTEMTDEDENQDAFLDDILEDSLLTPTIVVIADGEFEEAVVGADEVMELLEQVKDGTYAPFN